MQIIEIFQITGGGFAVAAKETTAMPVGERLVAVVTHPDGSTIRADAHKEYRLRCDPKPIEGGSVPSARPFAI